ncbi:glycosyltransferase family 4 protein [Halalkalibacter alkalisediminis]|uniref:Glycosyltransferase family 4 protein n=1 Tax=Halalkalibacter alkalisediminis TaxID=935616 RepID=A0ABV6NNN8_9BACI|nr:glycosyltransferase family 1 protein [Halalkalibacter alkalisediminis]
MVRVAIFTDTYAPEINGVAKTLERLTRYLAKNQMEFRVFAPETKATVPGVRQIERFASIPFFLYPQCRITLLNPLQINQTLEEFQPTLIHVATPLNLGLCGLYYGKKHHIPMVASYHTHFDQYLNYYNALFFQHWLWKYMIWFHRPFEKVFVPSESTKSELLKRGVHEDIDLWKRGVDHGLYTPERKRSEIKQKYQIKEAKVLLFVGRIAPEKDIDIVIETFETLPENIKKDTHLLIVGDGPLLKPLTEKTNDKPITFTGFLEGEELADVYASSDVFLFPSSTETFGNVVLEAMASGLPVVGANAGGVKHLIKHGENGLLCERKQVQSFAKETCFLLEHETIRMQFGYQARQYALMQSWDEVFAQLIQGYQSVIKRRRINTA